MSTGMSVKQGRLRVLRGRSHALLTPHKVSVLAGRAHCRAPSPGRVRVGMGRAPGLGRRRFGLPRVSLLAGSVRL